MTVEPQIVSSRVVLLDTLTNYMSWGTKIVIAVVLLRYNTENLVGDYNFWAWIWSVFSVVFLLDLGLGFSLSRFIPPANARGDITEIRRLLSAVFWFLTLGAIVIAALGTLATYLLPNVFAVFEVRFRWHFLLFVGFTAINFPINVFRDGALRAGAHHGP